MKPFKIFLTMLALSAMTVFVSSCKDDKEEEVTLTISVDRTYLNFEMEGGTDVVTITANGAWSVSGPNWIEVNPSSGTGDSGVLVTVPDNTDEESVTRSGTLTFSLKTGYGKVTVDVNQPGNDPVTTGGHGAGSDGVMKILSIGNSFAVDGVEQNLWDLFNAAGIEAVIGNMYIGNSTPEDHYNAAVTNSAAYSYRKIVNGVLTTKSDVTMLYGIQDNDWDYICFTTSGWQSALYDTKYVTYIPYLLSYAKSNATSSEMEVALHQVWAYPEDSTDSNYLKYFSGQMDMYNSIVEASRRAMEDFDVSILVPCGTAVQNGRNTYLGDSFNRDGRHLNYTYGRFTAACTWFETFSGMDVTTNSYNPAGIDDEIKDLTTHAAHFAVENPYEINPMVDWQDDTRSHAVEVREIATYATSATIAWNVDGCTEEEATAYAYTAKLYNDEACTDLRVSWKFDARDGSASTNGSSIWKPGNTSRVWFTFADLEPETDYWVKVNITGDETSVNEEPFKFTTTASFGTSIKVVSENAQAGDVVLMENFDKLIHGGDPANKAAGVYPTSSNRSSLLSIGGENPSSFSKDKWHSTGLGPFPHSYSNVKEAYTEAVGLSDWCVGTSSQGTTVTTRPGYIKVGRTNYMGYLATPEFKAIPDGKKATIKVEFKAMPYYYGSSYCNYIVMGIVNSVETDEYHQVSSWTTSADNGDVEDRREISVTQDEDEFHDYSVEFSDITNTSRIRFSSYNSSKGAFMLDDIVITVLSVEDI